MVNYINIKACYFFKLHLNGVGFSLRFWFALGLHFFEAVYVVKVAKSLGINAMSRNRWFFQTLAVGYLSTRLILAYRRKVEKKK